MKPLLRPVSGPLALLSRSLTLTLTLTSGLLAVPSITSTKDDATAAATRKVAGNNIDYTIQISNAAGATDALGVTLTDPTPTNTTLVAASVNVSPLAFDDAYAAVGNTQLRVGNPAAMAGPATSSATKVTANDMEFLGDTFAISSFQATSAQGGTVAMVTTGADAGSFSYLPPAGFEGTDTFTYTITDDGSAGFGALTSTATVTITVSEVVWYVDDSAAAGGTGRSNAPLQSLAPLNTGGALDATDEADDYIFVYSGNYSGAFVLEAGQRLIGEPAGLTVGGLTIAAGGTRPAFSHNAGTQLTLSTNNTVRGINFTNTAGNGITGSAVGTLTLSDFDITVTGGTALSVTTSGTVTATGTDNDLNSTNNTALNVANVAIGAAGLTFKSISSGAGAGNGIILDTTGTSGGLTVTGNGAPGTGGTIVNKTGANGSTTQGTGIYLNNTSGVSLDRMQLNDFQNFAIRGTSVTGFSLTNSTISGTNGNNNSGGVEEGSIRFENLFTSATFPTAQIANSSIGGGGTFNVWVLNSTNASTLNRLMLSNNIFGLISSTIGNDNVDVIARPTGANTCTLNVTVQDCTFAGTRSDFFETIADGNSTMNVVARRNKFNNGQAIIPGGGIALSIRGDVIGTADNVTFELSCNNITGGAGGSDTTQIFVGKGNGGGTWSGAIVNNTLGALAGNGGDGIFVRSTGSGTISLLVQDNRITSYGNIGLHFQNNDGSATMNATVYGNLVTSPKPLAFAGMFFDNGATATDTSKANLVVGSATNAALKNDFSAGDPANSTDVSLSNFNANTLFNLYKNGSGGGTAAAVIDDDNLNPAATNTNTSGGIGTITLVTSGLPTVPPTPAACGVAPLLFAAGGGEAANSDGTQVQENGCGCGCGGRRPIAAEQLPIVDETEIVENDSGLLRLADLDTLLSAAIARWEASGVTGEQLHRMERMTFTVEEMSGLYLGKAEGERITLNANAAGNRWFIDRTPGEDGEFSGSGTKLAASANGGAAGRVDALTTIVHELGHAVGLDDSYLEADRDSIMYGFLHLSERRLPRSGEAKGAELHDHDGEPHTHYLAAPITIGTLPPGKTVTIVYRTTVNAGITAPSVSNQGTVSGSNFANVLTDDLPQPGGTANATVTIVEVPPVVSNFARSTAEDVVLNFTAVNFTGAYTDANSDALTTVRITSLPANGTLKLAAANVTVNQDIPAASLGNLNYTPTQDYNGTDSFNWNASDGTLLAATGATVNLTVTEVNDSPTATADTIANGAEDAAPIVFAASTLVTNDSKGPANESTQTLTVTAVSAPVGGTVALNAGNITFTLTPDFNGAASFTYTVSDNGTTNGVAAPLTANGTVTFTVTEVNDAPSAVADTLATVAEDAAPIVFAASTLTTNDSKGPTNESAQTLTVTAVSAPVGGTVALNAGNITFTLTPNFAGTAGFTYTVQDNGTTNGAADFKTADGAVTFTVTAANDAPVLDASKSPALVAEDEDSGAPVGAVGTPITVLVDLTTPAGGLDNITDPDSGALLGIAVTGADTASGTWYYSVNNGVNWLALGAVSDGSARLLAADGPTRLYFQPNANFSGTLASAITFRAWDRTSGANGSLVSSTPGGGATAFSTATDTASLVVTALNDAPVLDATKSPVLTAISEDPGAPVNGSSAGSTLVSALVDFALPSGQVDNVTDPDTGAQLGIAVTAVPAGNTLYYSIDGGANWQQVVAPLSDANALLLAADAATRVYLVPAANFNGTITAALTFRAWDRSAGGSNGTLSSATPNGGSTAFSTATDTAALTVTSVNDDPVAGGDTITRFPTQGVKIPIATLLANDTDSDGGTVAFVSVSPASANGGTVTSDATTVYYAPAAGFTAADTFTYQINDGQGGTATGTVTVALVTDNAAGTGVVKIETLGDGSKRVTFAGIPGRTYRVQSSETLAPGSWTDRGSFPADAQGRFQFTDPPPLPPTRFYRSVQP